MKNIILISIINIVLGLCNSLSAQLNDTLSYNESILSMRIENDSLLKYSKNSPLPDSMQVGFKGISYFDVDERYRVSAKFIRTTKEPEFGMKTTTTRLPIYRKYGIAIFSLNGVKCELNIYQNVELIKKEEYKNHLFIPYTDETSGIECYAGGRYIDVEIPKGEIIIIDFNLSYNPYCNYNSRYSCPIPPVDNDLSIRIEAGEKDFH